MSHTSKIKVAFNDRDIFAQTIKALGGTVLGDGTHKLYSSTERGLGFQLPGWRYPLCLRTDQTIAFDDDHGSWGNVKDLDRLKAGYTIEVARVAAQQQGLDCEIIGENLIIQMPNGETITVTAKGTVDANGFTGTSCQEATAFLEQALGTVELVENKNELYEEQARIRIPE